MATETLRDDPTLVLPSAVRAQAARANDIVAAMQQPEPQQPEPQEADPATEEQPEAAPAPELNPEHLATKDGNPVTTEGNQPSSNDGLQEQLDALQKKYDSVNGRYKASQKEVARLQAQVEGLQNVIAAMNEMPVPASPEIKVEKLLTPEEENEYGKDLLEVIGKKAKEEVSPLLSGLVKQIEDLTKLVRGLGGQVQAKTTTDVASFMDDKLPNWREINTDQNFLDWLALPDAYSGVIRHELLKAAYSRGDANRVLTFFNGYLEEEAATKPVGGRQPNPTPARPAKVPLESLAAPGRAKTAPAPAPAEKPIFTRAEIAQFYADVAAGRYRGREADKDKFERDIFSAQAEGRIR